MIELVATVTGKVQGVSYRAFIEQAATELSLLGYVTNRDDGSVLVVAQGLPETLKTFVEYLHEGSLLAVVAGVAVEWRTAETIYHDFSIRAC